ncbi:MAG: hypothetical protein CVT74_15465 [Alphaproteobacteria bacterium HGW-Alphaproteobacteria-13]|jgi:hypothetical protein|nr:MAG: hypothetical protein CVT74_15465 [Alphaproteobacteria bacterium HGW-Alphaproteobacteria-13]
MATLVLTVVGGIVGGPVGAAVGAVLGQQADAAIFRPKGREGPRLADLKVQASTYGQQIPRLFGTMRVAGSVVWATDLIERRRTSGGGKGRPSVTEYSYAASLAVALSSRPIRAIRRIWADGNLLRGSTGRFQERCVFRWYDGSEDQAADPLIASAVGPASASAFRGIAYAVFEELELAAFGNRIPSLTFEVESDAGDVDAGLVADGLLGEAGRCEGRWPVAGYAASGERVRDALAPLFDVDGVRLVSGPEGWRLAPVARSETVPSLSAFRAARHVETESDIIERRRAPLSALPGVIRLRHYEPERDYQLGQQASAVAGGGAREERIDLPAVLPAGSARALAQQLAAAADERETLIVETDLAALALSVGLPLRLAGGDVWRLAARTVRDGRVTIELRRSQPLPVAPLPAEPGVAVASPDWSDAEGTVRLFDLPNFDNPAASTPRIAIAAAGSNDGWRGADLWFVAAAGAEPVPVGAIRPAAALGALAAALGAGPDHLFDGKNDLLVTLVNPAMSLVSVDDMRLLGGANRAMVGGEVIQFGRAEAVAPGLWRLSRLLRGRAGSDARTVHAAGTAFVLLDDAALMLLPDDMAARAEGGGAKLQWAPRGGHAIEEVDVPAAAAALRPPPPVHGRARSDGAGGLRVGWARRSRIDTGWRDHVDLPLGEAAESWRIALDPPVAGIGPWQTSAPSLDLDAAEVAAIPPGRRLEIRQAGDLALSPPLFLPLT